MDFCIGLHMKFLLFSWLFFGRLCTCLFIYRLFLKLSELFIVFLICFLFTNPWKFLFENFLSYLTRLNFFFFFFLYLFFFMFQWIVRSFVFSFYARLINTVNEQEVTCKLDEFEKKIVDLQDFRIKSPNIREECMEYTEWSK